MEGNVETEDQENGEMGVVTDDQIYDEDNVDMGDKYTWWPN